MTNGTFPAGRAARVRGRPGRLLAPLGEEPGALPLLDLPLRELQDKELLALGLPPAVDVEPGDPLPAGTRLCFTDDAVFTSEAAAALLAAAGKSPAQAAVPPGTALYDFVQPLSGQASGAPFLAPLWAGDLAGVPATEAEGPLQRAVPALVADEEACLELRVDPAGPPPHLLRVPLGARLVGRLVHWLHLLQLNHAFLLRERRRRGLLGRHNLLLGAAKLHPTALVEGSVVSAGVVVEHSASVLGCFLGEGVRVADHAVLVDTVVGKGCHTLVDTHLRRVVALPGSTLSNLGTSDLLLGREVFLTTGVAFFGERPGATAIVDGEDTRRPVLSGCVGSRAVLGARALFEGGVCLPAGTVIVMRPDEGLVKVSVAGLARAKMQLGDRSSDS
jgi:hypothetical protein